MKTPSLLIILLIILLLIPIYYINRLLQRFIQPRQSAARLFLFILANFLLVIVYTILVVGLVLQLFPPHMNNPAYPK